MSEVSLVALSAFHHVARERALLGCWDADAVRRFRDWALQGGMWQGRGAVHARRRTQESPGLGSVASLCSIAHCLELRVHQSTQNAFGFCATHRQLLPVDLGFSALFSALPHCHWDWRVTADNLHMRHGAFHARPDSFGLFLSGNRNRTSMELLQYLARRPGWHGEEARDARLVLRVLGVLARGEGLGNVE